LKGIRIVDVPDGRRVTDRRFFNRRKNVVYVAGTIATGILSGKHSGAGKRAGTKQEGKFFHVRAG